MTIPTGLCGWILVDEETLVVNPTNGPASIVKNVKDAIWYWESKLGFDTKLVGEVVQVDSNLQKGYDTKNSVTFARLAPGILGTCKTYTALSTPIIIEGKPFYRIREFEIVLSTAVKWNTATGYSAFWVMVHELGHALGLIEQPTLRASKSIMTRYSGTREIGQIDIDRLRWLYRP
ncbi:MAG: Matrixin [Methanosaeta sp. PtaB.Bin039]|nr:MAG: Matrixin [Methanosaeta sp. PtaB.Bin039]HQF17655.1 matrixin family metalloprotease [Methanotrichaceae archaeon]HQI92243.1 matrixin family metalloprotease [Methanotrichaceae archaeon]